MAAPVSAVVGPLTRRHRVLLLGGLAVIAHGHSRHTKDADVWLDPMASPNVWLAALRSAMFTPYVPGKKGGIGYGWFLRTGDHGRPLQFHSGNGAGFRAWNFRLPQARLAVVLLSNVAFEDSSFVFALLERIEKTVEK